MNAPALPGAIAAAAFQIVPIAAFAPSGTRTQERRRRRFPKEKLAELAASIRQIGVMQPIVARPHPKASPPIRFEIVAGEHRWRAAGMAGLVEVNAVIREIPDAELVQFQLTENLQRQTIDALEEAEGYRELQVAKKFKAEQVADLLGVSRTTVFNRLKLLDLCPEAIAAVEAGSLTPSNAMLIARIGHHDTQRQVLKQALEGGFEEVRNEKGHYVKAPLPYRELRSIIETDYMVDLKGAPFKLDDEASFPKPGSCAKCPKRTGNQRELFSEIKNPNVCTDPKCFDDKRQIVFRKAADELRAKGRKVIAGADAKKIMERWDEDFSDDRISGGFTAMDEKQYSSGRIYGKTPRQILGKDYQPIVVQHPGSGKLIEVASAQAIAAAAKGGKPGADDEDLPARVRAKKSAAKIKLPDLDAQVTERLVQLIGEKAPKKFNRSLLISVVKLVLPQISSRGDKLELIAKRFGWSRNAFGRGYSDRGGFPKAAAGFDETKIMLLLLYAVWAAGWGPHGHEDVLEFLGIDDDKTRQAIIAERKQLQTNARMKAKLAKALPLAKSKGKKARRRR